MKKEQKGITLVALVITIIVLLILAGVTIASLSGENGILTRGSQAVSSSDIASAKEQVNLAFNDAMSAYYEARYVSESLNTLEGGTTETAVAFIAEKLSKDSDFTEVAEITTTPIDGDEESIDIQLKKQNADQTETITNKIIKNGNSAKLEGWSDEKAST